MSLDELYEWEAYYQLEPFGSPADDDRWRMLYSLYFSVNAKPGTEHPDWLDRDPEETLRRRASITMEDKMEAFFGSLAVDED
jgi:hypothetical protein